MALADQPSGAYSPEHGQEIDGRSLVQKKVEIDKLDEEPSRIRRACAAPPFYPPALAPPCCLYMCHVLQLRMRVNLFVPVQVAGVKSIPPRVDDLHVRPEPAPVRPARVLPPRSQSSRQKKRDPAKGMATP